MHSRWYNITVVLLWLATMSWLLATQILPAILVGEPPNYLTILEARRHEPAVAWTLSWNEHELGWALNTTKPLPEGMTQVSSRIHFDELPLAELIPDFLRVLLGSENQLPTRVPMETDSRLIFDPLGRLSRFESSVRFSPFAETVKVRGTADGDTLVLSVHSGNLTYEMERVLPGKAMFGDALSPQTCLPGLREGQKWTIELYNPLRPPSDPLEVLIAEVEGTESIVWNDQPVQTWLVVYRNDPGAVVRSTDRPRGRLWVQSDGIVLKQQVMIFNSVLTFVRLPDDVAAEMAEKLGNWSQIVNNLETMRARPPATGNSSETATPRQSALP